MPDAACEPLWGTVAAREVMHFLADRLTGNGGERGVSSDALISAAIKGHVPAGMDKPRDLGDFARCCDAFHRAPAPLRERMLPILSDWAEELLHG